MVVFDTIIRLPWPKKRSMKKATSRVGTFCAIDATKHAAPNMVAIIATIICTPKRSIILPIFVRQTADVVVAIKYDAVTVVREMSKSLTMTPITTPMHGDWPGAVKILPTVHANRITYP